MISDSGNKTIINYDQSIKPDSPVPEASADFAVGEGAISDIQCYLRKYSTTSSVFAEQSITNPDYQRTLYCISCILQAELFDDLADSAVGSQLHPELVINTTLPPHLGGLVECVPEDILERECRDDPELRREIEHGQVPTVDTILRFISWLHQSAKYSAQCNIIAFIYIKRMMDAKLILTMNNWRGMWLGSVVLAQKVWDDSSLRTSSFASILPGVAKSELKALELKIFTLLNYCTSVKPSVFARFYFELREIFKNITGEFCDATVLPDRAPRRRPLTIKKGKVLKQCADDIGRVTQSSKSTSPRSKRTGTSSVTTAHTRTGSGSVASLSPVPRRTQNHVQDGDHNQSGCDHNRNQCDPDATATTGRLPPITSTSSSPSRPNDHEDHANASQRSKSNDDGAGTFQQSATAPRYRDNGNSSQGVSAATTPGGSGGSGRRNGFNRKAPVTLEDYDYVNSSIFVLS